MEAFGGVDTVGDGGTQGDQALGLGLDPGTTGVALESPARP